MCCKHLLSLQTLSIFGSLMNVLTFLIWGVTNFQLGPFVSVKVWSGGLGVAVNCYIRTIGAVVHALGHTVFPSCV